MGAVLLRRALTEATGPGADLTAAVAPALQSVALTLSDRVPRAARLAGVLWRAASWWEDMQDPADLANAAGDAEQALHGLLPGG